MHELFNTPSQDHHIIPAERLQIARHGNRLLALRFADGPHAVISISKQGVDVKLVIPHQGPLKESAVPIRIAFKHENADLLINNVEVGNRTVVGGVHFVI
ncbi:hypothetical protein SDC9_189711 [bioreactor metagenome]|uniref:Uncharacterized protein n=1 Tax=bioreactor metagenome TaxID=1076179 RepID=A0A645HSX3_9ZZZZ